MRSSTGKLSFLFIFLFFTALLLSAYTLYYLPEQMLNLSPAVDLLVLSQLQPAFVKVYVVSGITSVLGMLTIVYLLSQRQRPQVEFSSRAKEENGKVTQTSTVESGEQDISCAIDQHAIEKLMEAEESIKFCFDKALSMICNALEASQAAAYLTQKDEDKRWIELFSSYAYHLPDGEKVAFRLGEGLAGQVAKEGKLVNINTVPEGYIRILSGLGNASPRHLIILPLRESDEVIGVVEIASFREFSAQAEAELQQAFDKLALKLVNVDNVSLEKGKR
jgi:putative methionine-R-sulfoxide reductase with GAF domain